MTAIPQSTKPLTAQEFRDALLSITGSSVQPVSGTFYPATQPVSAVSLPLPAGAATSASQATLESLIDTLQELIQRLAPLAGVANTGGPMGLRVVGVSMPSTAVTGPITSAQSLAEKGPGGPEYPMILATGNLTAHLTNINNCVGS